jgi:hypothetical protein
VEKKWPSRSPLGAVLVLPAKDEIDGGAVRFRLVFCLYMYIAPGPLVIRVLIGCWEEKSDARKPCR